MMRQRDCFLSPPLSVFTMFLLTKRETADLTFHIMHRAFPQKTVALLRINSPIPSAEWGGTVIVYGITKKVIAKLSSWLVVLL